MVKSISKKIKYGWGRTLACLLAVVAVAGLLSATANAAEGDYPVSTMASRTSVPTYAPTGGFETNIAGSTGWNGTRLPLPVYDAESGGAQILTVPTSDNAEPISFALLEYNGGDRVKVGLATDDAGAVTAWDGGEFGATGWVDKDWIFVNLPDLVPSAAYNITNSSGCIFRAVGGTAIPGVTGKQFYQAKKQFNSRLSRYEFVVPCMFTLAERLAGVQKAAMTNGETLIIYETFRPASVQSAVRDSFGKLWDSDSTVAADMNKAISMGYARNQGWFISGGTSNHQAGLAVDMSLAKGDPGELHEYTLGGVTYQKYEAWTEYNMPTPMHQLSSAAIRYRVPVTSWAMPSKLDNWTEQFAASEGAKRLQRYCTDAGLIPLASEWWHYNDPSVSRIMGKGSYAGKTAINTLGNYNIDRAYSVAPHTALTELSGVSNDQYSIMTMATGDTGGLNPGSAGGQRPQTSDVAWSTDPKRTFLRFTLVEFPQGVVTDLTGNGAWRVVGTPINVVWGKGTHETWDAAQCRSKITWYDSCALQFNAAANPAQLMAGTVYAYNATGPHNSRMVTTADEFQAETGISDEQKEQMFDLGSSRWSTGWINGDYTSMWGTDPHPVSAGNAYQVYKANDAFVYLLGRLSETGGEGTGWSEEDALSKWADYVHDSQGNLRTKYRIIIETGSIFEDPDGVLRAYTLREMMAYSLYNNETPQRYSLVWDQSSTACNMAQWMRQSKDNQFVEYPLREDGTPTGEELHSVNGFSACDSYVDSLRYGHQIRSKIFADRASFGLHIMNPFNFEQPDQSGVPLEVTKLASSSLPGPWNFTVTYTSGTPTGFTAAKNGVDCTDEVTDNGSSLQFSLDSGDTISIIFEADDSFRYSVREDDDSQLTNITGFGGSVDMRNKTFTYNGGGTAKATFINGTLDEDPPVRPSTPTPIPGDSIVYKRDAKTNAGVGPATFRFASVSNGDYEFTTNSSGELEPIQWWDPTEQAGKYIKPGEYAVTEQIPPPNYTSTSEVKQIKLELDEYGNPIPAGPLVFQDSAKAGLRIVKYDRLSHRPLSGVTFAIFKDGASIGRYETTSSGEILLTDIEPGTYLAFEVDAGDDSHLLNGTYQEVELEAGDGIKDLIFFNDVKPGLRLVKVDSSDPAKTISGAVFEVKAVAGDYGPEEFTTGADGTIDLSKLPEGAYVVVEKSCPGYVIDDAQRIIYLRANDNAEFVFTNTRKPSLRLLKSSADGTPLDGVTYKITPIGDASHSIDRTTSNGGEILVDGLEPGIYSVREVTTVPDHILDPTEHHVQLSPGQATELRLSNDKRPNLTIYKRDADTGDPISDTVFLVKTADGHSVQEVKTGPDGAAIVENLMPGVYEIVEKSVPSPYLLDAGPQFVTLYANEDREIYVENHKAPIITVIKENSLTHERLANVRFQVWYVPNDTETGEYNDLGVYTTDENGCIVLTEPQVPMRDGWFRVKEMEPPKGFGFKDSDTQEAFVPAGKSHTFYFQNTPLSAIIGWKFDSVSGLAVEGCIFQVRYLGGTSGTGGTVIGTYKTSANGSFTVTGLQAGTYIIEELASDSHHVIDTAPQTVYISGEDQDVVQVYFGNAPKGNVLVKKVSASDGAPLSDVEFLVTTSDGTVVGNANGKYVTDSAGSFLVEGVNPGTTLVIKETRAKQGYLLDDTPQAVQVKAGVTVVLEYRNQPTGNLIIEKLSSADMSTPLEGVEFELRYADGSYVDNGKLSSLGKYYTNKSGQIILSNITGTVIVTEVKTIPGYRIDPDTSSQTVTINPDDTQILRFYNEPVSGIVLHKTDAMTGRGICGVRFTLYDSARKPIGEYETDQDGYIYIDDIVAEGSSNRFYLRELENPGYLVDNELKTVYVKPGETTEVEWENTPITGQIQITKTSADYNSNNGWAAGTPLPDVEFEIYDYRTNNLVDTIRTDKNGLAKSRPLPLGRYKIVESKAAKFYELNTTPIEAELEFSGQIVKLAMTNKSVNVNVSIKKTGYTEVMPGQSIRYDFSGIGNNSNVSLSSFYWRDTLPVDAVRLDKIVTGTFNAPGNYKIVYQTNLSGGTWRTLADNLSTSKNHVLDASPAALRLASNEYVTQFMFTFGVVPANFRQVEAPQVYCTVLSSVGDSAQFVNQADVGGVYQGQWYMAATRWVTKVYRPATPLPRTGY